MAASSSVYQFKITLKGPKPAIWRRILVPETFNFYDLHHAIQDAMGWQDCHLHLFDMKNPQTNEKISIGKPLSDYGFEKVISGKNVKIAEYFVNINDKAVYEYDFGDGWEHDIVLEQIMPAQANVKYPLCTAGERACPPEDCGGVWGYEELLKILADSDQDEEKYLEKSEWLYSNGYHPYYFEEDEFDPDDVYFQNSDECETCS